jgi:hypothetical protein
VIKLIATVAAALLAALLLLTGCGGSSSTSVDPSAYSIKIFNGWPQVKKEEKVGGYIENAWRDPESPIIAVDTRAASDDVGSPMAGADVARIQTSELPEYKERSFKRVKLGSRSAVSFAYDIAEERAGIDFFFEECGISFVVRGTMGQYGFEALAPSIRSMAETIKVKGCDE